MSAAQSIYVCFHNNICLHKINSFGRLLAPLLNPFLLIKYHTLLQKCIHLYTLCIPVNLSDHSICINFWTCKGEFWVWHFTIGYLNDTGNKIFDTNVLQTVKLLTCWSNPDSLSKIQASITTFYKKKKKKYTINM